MSTRSESAIDSNISETGKIFKDVMKSLYQPVYDGRKLLENYRAATVGSSHDGQTTKLGYPKPATDWYATDWYATGPASVATATTRNTVVSYQDVQTGRQAGYAGSVDIGDPGLRETNDADSDCGESWYPLGDSAPNCWLPPSNDDSVWCGVQDRELKRFYDDFVNIRGVTFQDVQMRIDKFLKNLYEELKKAESTYTFLRLKPFLKQGGSREGLKVGAANEFDALLPFTFVGITSDIREAPQNQLPPGLAEICIEKISNRVAIRPADLFVERGGQKYVRSDVFHDKLFKSLIDAAVQKFNSDPEWRSYEIRRQASAPAIKLDVKINGNIVSIDVVPGFEISAATSSLRKFVVTRWIPGSKNVTRTVRIPEPTTVWRVSHSHFEMHVFDKWGVGNITGKRLVRAARILKGLRVKDKDRNTSSQLHSVLTSYHIKNILLHSLLCLTKVNAISLSSVSEALGYLVFMLNTALTRHNLPQFFSFNPSLRAYFPESNFHNRSTLAVNLFAERSTGEILQVRADLAKALRHFNLQQLLDRTGEVDWSALRPFMDNVNA
ncbi:uncharacterized protein LOC132544634 [Ylistrum balloti]|uniref:uncharacterized protein LOC132544634 n=1 Tax=Ylistrum balloti TaxID=509963 RepID=UPI002905CDAD|nr:uncharacterized protein LOC132544634 [Ylistrum balloti]